MKIFYSNMGSAKGLEKYLQNSVDILVSYYGTSKINKLPYYQDLFLDSGAFSAMRQKKIIDPHQYAEFLKIWKDQIFVYAGLDVIGDPEKTWKNQRILEKEGLSPLPTFHYKEDFKWLRRYVDKYDYIAIGGMVPLACKLHGFLDQVWEYILKTKPDLKVHGFGIQAEQTAVRYPWYSIDATSVHMQARYGGIRTPWGWLKINPKVNGNDLKWHTPLQLKKVKKYVEALGFTFKDAQAPTPEATLIRCAISIVYYEKFFKKNQYTAQTKQKNNFNLHV